MKKLLLAAMLVMAVVGVPAIADVEQPPGETTQAPPAEQTVSPPPPTETPPTPMEETTSPPAPNETPPTPPVEEVTSPPSPSSPDEEVTSPPSPPPETAQAPPPAEQTVSPPPSPPDPPPTSPAQESTSSPSPPSPVDEGVDEAPKQMVKAQEADGADANQEADDKGNVVSEQQDKNDPRDNNRNDPRGNRWNGPPGNLWGAPPNNHCNDPRDSHCNNNDLQNGDLSQAIGQEAESGDVNQSANVTNTGNNVNQCVAVLQAANTGNLQNGQGAAQDRSKANDIQVGGSRITVTPQLVQDCRQIILQVTAAQQSNGIGGAKAIRGNAIGSNALGGIRAAGLQGSVINPLSVVRPGLSVGQPRIGQALVAPTGGRLPRTGGLDLASLLTLGAGILLIGGGLLARRLSR